MSLLWSLINKFFWIFFSLVVLRVILFSCFLWSCAFYFYFLWTLKLFVYNNIPCHFRVGWNLSSKIIKMSRYNLFVLESVLRPLALELLHPGFWQYTVRLCAHTFGSDCHTSGWTKQVNEAVKFCWMLTCPIEPLKLWCKFVWNWGQGRNFAKWHRLLFFPWWTGS